VDCVEETRVSPLSNIKIPDFIRNEKTDPSLPYTSKPFDWVVLNLNINSIKLSNATNFGDLT